MPSAFKANSKACRWNAWPVPSCTRGGAIYRWHFPNHTPMLSNPSRWHVSKNGVKILTVLTAEYNKFSILLVQPSLALTVLQLPTHNSTACLCATALATSPSEKLQRCMKKVPCVQPISPTSQNLAVPRRGRTWRHNSTPWQTTCGLQVQLP